MLNPTIGGSVKIIRPRAFSATWPSGIYDFPLPQNGTAFGTPGWLTDAGVAWSSSSSTVTGTGTRTWGTGFGYRGRGVIIHAAGAGGTARSHLNGANIFPYSEQGGEWDNSFSDELGFRRTVVVMAFEPTGGFALGCGVHFSAFNVGNPDILGGAMGFGFQRTALGVVSLVSRAALGVGGVVTHATFAPPGGQNDLLKFNVYEAIAYPSRRGYDGRIAFKVNGDLIATKIVGTIADLGCPTNPQHSNGPYGLIPSIIVNNNSNQVAVAGVRYQMGPTESSVLAY